MELLQLRYFQSIARHESVTRAAKEFQIPQSAMSQTLSRLEKELGDIKLFDRKNNRLYLNENGKMFLCHVNEALLSLDNGVQTLKQPQDQIKGPIHLLVLENSRFVINCISQFTKKYPDVSFNICHDFYSDEISNYDLCVTASPSYRQMNRSLPLIKEPMVLAVYDTHPLANRNCVRLSELAYEKFITQSARSSLYSLTVEHCRAAGFDPRISISCDDPYYIRKYISEGMGIAISPFLSWAGRFRENTRLIHIIDPEITCTSYLLWNDKKYQSPAVQRFRHFLRDQSRLIDGNMINEAASAKNEVSK